MTDRSFQQKKWNAVLNLMTAFFLSLLSIGTVVAQPVATFSAMPVVGCAPLTVNFTNNSTQANSFYWDFGNGNTSTLQNPTSVYLTSGFFTVKLIAVNTLTGQSDTMTSVNYIHVLTPPPTSFTASPLSACSNNNLISFTNSSTGAVTYTWDFGDGNSSSLQNPTYSYSNPGTYTVKLIAINGSGCNNIAIRNNYITINPAPDASFTANNTSTCNANQAFNFSGSGTGITAWNWNFGDGTTSLQQNPSHIYSTAGAYNVTLIATNNFGCTDTVTANNYINIGASLVPGYTVNNSSGCGSLTANFQCTVPNTLTWLWNFGDGTTSTQQNPSHQYNVTGNYTITLTVTTVSGCNGTASYPNAIMVDPLPVSNFSVSQVDPCNPYTWHFINTSINGAVYLWEFGDGTTSTQFQPTHTYTADDVYDVTLHVYTANGCDDVFTFIGAVDINDLKPSFSSNPQIGCAPLPVAFSAFNYTNATSYQWSFGDGATASGQNTNHTYTANGNYTVKLVITTSGGCIDSLTKPNHIRVVPGLINYTVPDTVFLCYPNTTAAFTDPTLGSSVWHWDFGDGDTSNIKNPSHIYPDTGIYIVTLQTNMAGGCSQFINPYAIVHIIQFDVPPPNIISSSVCSPFQLQITDSAVGGAQWNWDFGDGTISTLQSPTHIYAQAGTYTISVTLVAPVGCRIVESLQVTFGHPNPLIINNSSTCTDDTIHFVLGTPAAFTSWSWDFGDSSPISSQQNPNHLYPVPGDYIVTLTTNDTSGCTDIYTDTLQIRTLNPDFTTNDPHTNCMSRNIHFINTTAGATSYLWDFGDSTTATSQNPTHLYNIPGTYNVSLTAMAGGCIRTVVHPNYITYNLAHANFSFIPDGLCFPMMVTYTDLSTNPVSWLWNFGDGQTSSLQNPVHLFASRPTSNVTLTITDVNGCSGSKSMNNVAGIDVQITASDTLGCMPLNVNFNDLTSSVTAWHWDFGDGSSSTQQNPSHTFSDTGSYTITLVVTLSSGCNDTVIFPDYIHVMAPAPDFISPTVAVCAPSLVTFNNLTQNGISYLWDFGDGTTSTAANPSHIYNIPGYYTISLTAYDSLGCSSTEIKVDYIHVPGTYSHFNLVSQINCLQTLIAFTDSSINASSWSWNFGDGYTSTLQNPQHLYQDTGSYIVSLITADSSGCSSFYVYPDSIVVHPNPVAAASTTDPGGCSPYAFTFNNQSTGATNYSWHFGNGDSSSLFNPVYTYLDSGMFTVSLVAINQYGCTDTFFIATPLNVKLSPNADFTISSATACYGTPLLLSNTSTGISNPSYYWTIGSITSTMQNPSVTPATPGFYTVSLLVTNANGCRNSMEKQNLFQVYDTLPPLISPIMSVSVKNNTSVDIRWLPSTAFDLEAYKLYRLNTANGNYNLIYTELHPNNSNPNVTGIFTDTLLNTLQNVYTYKLQTVDLCGYTQALDSCIAHTTINVTAQTQGTNIQVRWTPYGGCPVSSYEIHRVEVINGSSQLLATVPSNQLNYLDQNLNCPYDYSYRITALDLCGNPYASLSDTSVAAPLNTLITQKVDVVRSTVVYNKSVLTEWSDPNIAPERVLQYNILRSTDSLSFSLIASVPASLHSYMDESVDVNHQNYFYKVDVINDCNLAGMKSNNSSSILLQSDWVHERPKLWWTEYNKWDNGVDHYTIEKKNDAGQWIEIKTVNGTTTETELEE
jgi:PKD repeat protein